MEADCIPPSNYFDDERIDLTDVVRKKKIQIKRALLMNQSHKS